SRCAARSTPRTRSRKCRPRSCSRGGSSGWCGKWAAGPGRRRRPKRRRSPRPGRAPRASPKRGPGGRGGRWGPAPAGWEDSRAFGPMVAGEAQARDFYAAARRAFVADGQAYNWAIQRGYFPDFVPIVDFLHVICYLFSAAQVLAQEGSQRWARYEAWVRACWQGRAAEVVRELETAQ